MPMTDQQRVAALHRYSILDTPKESTFDIITSMVSEMLQVPHACVSLVDEDRVWFKSAFGVDAPEVKREPGFCSTLVASDEAIRHIEDAAEHPETKNNSLVRGGPGIRFYAGAPLSSPQGHRIGTLCAFGPSPRGISHTECSSLLNLATLVMNEIELRSARRELERTEAALRKSQRLESIGMVASGIAHDLNNLLGGMLGYAELLQMEYGGSATGRELIAELVATGRRAGDLVGQVLTYVGRGEESPVAPTDLNTLIRETHHMLVASLDTRARIHLELAEDLPAVLGQSTGLRQLVMNLLTNASQACVKSGGNVWIATTVNPDEDCIVMIVTDDGHGLTPELRERIFEPFFSTKSGGRGLGLAICQRIVEQHGGTLAVESEIGKGASFKVTLPACRQSPAKNFSESEERKRIEGEGLILVVDDEPAICEIARRSLERAGYEVLLAKGGARAIEILDEGHDVSAVVLDWSMPGVSGEQVLQAMRERHLTWPVVLSSGHSEADAREKVKTSVESFLSKPYTIEELLLKVKEAQARDQWKSCQLLGG